MSPPDLGAFLSMWGAGLAAFAALVGSWNVARAGYLRLVAVVIGGLSLLALFAGAPPVAIGATLGSGLAAWRNDQPEEPWALAIAAVFLFSAGREIGWLALAVGAFSLGAITSEMILGHWFLVDPKLPRWPLRRLAVAGVIGALVEGLWIAFGPAPTLLASRALLATLAGLAALLMVGVLLSLRVRAYTGVMAATGLSYLATLVALSVAIISRPAV